ncbi:MAG: Flp pilus assembly complex ATPase component TadA [Victivallaceae bacterium]|nr:Flp pilus assembly complex ATPase component TadA [Victivallaceae bacterium]
MLDAEAQSLKDILLMESKCNEEQLQEAEDEHDRSGKPYLQVIIDYGLLTEAEILQLEADSLGTEIVDLAGEDASKKVIELIEPDIARQYGVIPVEFDDVTLKVVSKNPLNYQIAEELRFILGYDIQVCIAREDQIDASIEKYYPTDIESVQDMLSEFEDEGHDLDSDADIESVANETPIVKFVDVILYQAIRDKASDVHFEPFEKEFRIRYRIDGALYEMAPPPKNLAVPVISRIKILSNLNISERRKPQDGRIQLKVGGKKIDLRVSCLPTAYGESVVLRILDRSVVNLSLEALGIADDVMNSLREISSRPNGILLVTGPTGSGKTTTLYSCLNEINDIGDKILTAEDPVEYDIEGIIQLPINDGVGMTFLKALRAFLRQDPDRIMIGEIRDFESAQMAIQASLTGHFVFSTLHTNDAAGTVTRLIDMGIEPFLINSALVGVFSQRLVRKICTNCKTHYDPTDDDLKLLDISREDVGNNKFCYGKGCAECNETGYKGRKAICEMLMVNSEVKEVIATNPPTSAIQEVACAHGMRTIREDGIRSVMLGETTVDEVARYTK